MKHHVRVWLAVANKTQSWLAHKVRVDESTLSAVLAGRKRPTPELIAALLAITGIDLDRVPRTRRGAITRAAVALPAAGAATVEP